MHTFPVVNVFYRKIQNNITHFCKKHWHFGFYSETGKHARPYRNLMDLLISHKAAK